MPSTMGKCKLFRIKHITLLGAETFLRNKQKIAFCFLKNCTFFGRKENTIRLCSYSVEFSLPHRVLKFLKNYHSDSNKNFCYLFPKEPSVILMKLGFIHNYYLRIHSWLQNWLQIKNKQKKKNTIGMEKSCTNIIPAVCIIFLFFWRFSRLQQKNKKKNSKNN